MKRWVKVTLAAIAVSVAAIFLLFHYRVPISRAGLDLLLMPANPEKADVIFVMGGYPLTRLPLAIQLYRDSFGREILCPTENRTRRDREFEARFGFRTDEQFIVAECLKRSGMPESSVTILPGSTSTWSDLLLLKNALASRPESRVIVVSDAYHFRRIDFCVVRIFSEAERKRLYYAYPPADEMVADLTDEEDLAPIVVNEMMKVVAYRLKY